MDSYRLEKIMVQAIKIGVCAALFLPLVVGSQFFFPFIVLKNSAFRIVAEIIFFLAIVLILKNKKYRPDINILAFLTIIYVAIITLTTFTGIGLERGFWGNYERMGGVFRFWHLLMYFFVLISVFKEKKDWNSFLTFSIFSSIIMSFFALSQQLQVFFLIPSSGGERISGTIGNPTYLGAYILINLFFILYFIFKVNEFDLKLSIFSLIGADLFLVFYDLWVLNLSTNKTTVSIFSQLATNKNFFLAILSFHIIIFLVWFLRNNKWVLKGFLGVLFIFELVIIYWTQTRGALLGILLAFLFLAIAAFFTAKNKIIKISIGVALLILILMPILLRVGRNTDFVKNSGTLNRLATTSMESITVESRLLTWKASWRGWTEEPLRFIFGFGQENFFYVFNKYFPSDIFKDLGSQIWFDRAHNIILDVGITSGLLGLMTYLLLYIVIIYYLFKRFKKTGEFAMSFVFIALLLAYFIQNLFVFDTFNTYVLFFLILGFMSVNAVQPIPTKIENSLNNIKGAFRKLIPSKKSDPVIIGILLVVTIFSIYFYNIQLLKANNYIFKALKSAALPTTPDKFGDFISGRQDYFKLAIEQAVTGRYEAREQLANFTINLMKNKSIPKDLISPLAKYTFEELEKSITEEPFNVRHYLYVSGLYNQTSAFDNSYLDRAIELLKKAIPLSPTRPQIYFELGQSYFSKGDIATGLRYFEEGVSHSKKVLETQMDMMAAYMLADFPEKALETYDYARKNLRRMAETDYKRIFNICDRTGRYDIMLLLYHDMIKRFPSSSDAYAGIAAAYAAVGENQKAELYARNAVEIDASFKPDSEKFLQELKAGNLFIKKVDLSLVHKYNPDI